MGIQHYSYAYDCISYLWTTTISRRNRCPGRVPASPRRLGVGSLRHYARGGCIGGLWPSSATANHFSLLRTYGNITDI